MKKDSLEKSRCRISRIDRRLTRLLYSRYRLVLEVGLLKRKQGIPVKDEEREKEILKRLSSIKRDGGFKNFLEEVYTAIFRASRRVESRDGDF